MRIFPSLLRSKKGRVDIGAPTELNASGKPKLPREILLFFFIIGLTGLALGLSDQVFSNYFKDVYQIDAATRGLIEFPRELPGILCLFIIAAGSFLGDFRMAMVAQIVALGGIVVLGLVTPSFGVMLGFLFINSLGMHVSMPLNDSIGISLVKDGRVGSRLGQYNGVRTAMMMVAGGLVFIGFRTGFFSFNTPIIIPFLLSGICFAGVFILYVRLNKMIGPKTPTKRRKIKFIFRKEYKYYYMLSILQGAHKQIMIVFGPWVLIDLLSKKADTLALLSVVGAAIGIFFLPMLGKWIDRFGTRPLLAIEGVVLFILYATYGVLSAGFSNGSIAKIGAPVVIVFILFSLNKLAMHFRMVRVVYLQSIAISPEEITPTLSTGLSLDHVVSIALAAVGGGIWNSFGPEYVFYMLAFLSIFNIIVAILIGSHPADKPKLAAKN